MANLNIADQIAQEEKRICEPEEMLGKGLYQPFSSTNSGSRKIMHGIHLEHTLPLLTPEPALVRTGYEDKFGVKSSSFVTADSDYKVLVKIPKFTDKPDHHYFLIVQDLASGKFDVIERIGYRYVTESYGYLYNNSNLDSLNIGDSIARGSVIRKSLAFDENNNRQDGVNLITAYMSCDNTMEDGIIISESASKKLTAPLVKPVQIVINDNDILLNLYGDLENYKTFPDIGEEIKDGILCATRREDKEQSLYMQSYNRLRDIIISDDKYVLNGEVVDINVYCNNVENISESFYNKQLLYYHNQNIQFAYSIVNSLERIMKENKCDYHRFSYDLQKLYDTNKRILRGDQYIKDKPFSNIILEIFVLEKNETEVGDKLSDRYGGKGVISEIRKDEFMPVLDNGDRVEIIFNSSTCINRLNAGQLFELSLTHIGQRILDFASSSVLEPSDVKELYLKYIQMISEDLYGYMKDVVQKMDEDDFREFINSIQTTGIALSIKPMSESMNIDKLRRLYREFSWATPCSIIIPIMGSDGKYRYTYARRNLVCGKKYIYRLKQYAEEKFSATSLSATNIRNENTKSKVNKSYKSLYSRTPIKFGEMETGDMSHLGMEIVITNLMIHSVSPKARRLTEQMLTGDPFITDIKLDDDASNRSAEILNTYLKSMGLKFVFNKRLKKPIIAAMINPISMTMPTLSPYGSINPIYITKQKDLSAKDYLSKYYESIYNKDGMINPIMIDPIVKEDVNQEELEMFIQLAHERRKREIENEQKRNKSK